jgi:hypothetical protein
MNMEMIRLNSENPMRMMKGLPPERREEFLEMFQEELEQRFGLPIEAIADMVN